MNISKFYEYLNKLFKIYINKSYEKYLFIKKYILKFLLFKNNIYLIKFIKKIL